MQVLITGANRGIGAALANVALAAGHQVIGTTRSRAGLNEQIEWIELDVTSPESEQHFATIMAGGSLDLLICNAGVYPDKACNKPEDYTADIWHSALSVNVTGVWMTIQAVLKNLKAAEGKIAIISSKMGSSTLSPGGSYAYRASKAAVTNLACNLAADLKPAGISVASYHPGWVRTDMGGEGGDISVEESAAGLWEQISQLTLETSGVFEAYNGDELEF